MSTLGENAAELVGDDVCGQAGEDVADRAVEVEQESIGVCQDASDGIGIVDWDPFGAHRLYSVLIVFHMLSNHVRACSTYWLPVLVSSSVIEWWKRMASLPIRS
ncbi:hypothetical protein SAMN05216553_1319 [Lentzea fradiae]|uniref:Uncharacterized protein n=1 Tax=Lentzea fradiae TaxID=200378 RepID=A0A1G8DLC1_9PSEU|nr:hypothetical protein SAMN05216553_1319 [Lentzea fradiae]